MKCPECKETKNIKKFGTRWGRNAKGVRIKKQQFQCNECGRIFIGKE